MVVFPPTNDSTRVASRAVELASEVVRHSRTAAEKNVCRGVEEKDVEDTPARSCENTTQYQSTRENTIQLLTSWKVNVTTASSVVSRGVGCAEGDGVAAEVIDGAGVVVLETL